MKKPELILSIIALVSCVSCFCQRPVMFQWQDGEIKIKGLPANAAANVLETENLFVKEMYDAGYLSASVDSSYILQDTLVLQVFHGPVFKWVSIQPEVNSMKDLRSTGVNIQNLNGERLSLRKFSGTLQRILDYFEDRGYPYVRAQLDSIEQDSVGGVSAVLKLDKGSFYRIDSVIYKAEGKFPVRVVRNATGIEPGDVFNQSKIEAIAQQLKGTGFLKSVKPAEVELDSGRTHLYVYLKAVRSSFANGILGVLPDADNQKLTVTGDLRVSLKNSLGAGELFDLNWRRLQTKTQDLNAALFYPYLLNTPFSPDLKLKIYKKDTTFIEVTTGIGFKYLMNCGNLLKATYRSFQSSVLNQKQYEGYTSMPALNDVRSNLYGVGFELNTLDYRPNPRKGTVLDFDVSAGNRKIVPNSLVDADAYFGVRLNSTQIMAAILAQQFVPMGRKFTLLTALVAATRQAPVIYQNELFRIGGLKVLRGFDEESVQATSYAVLTTEFRLIFEENSYLFVFGDAAWTESRLPSEYTRDLPYGFGAGIAFQTAAGVFSINTALGSRRSNPLDLRSTKVHFGFVNFF